MKIPITDKFLWDLYNLLESVKPPEIPRKITDALSPDFFRLKQEWSKRKRAKGFSRLIYYLKKKGLIDIENLKGKKAILLTKKGSERVLKISLKTAGKKYRADGKWQMIIFDIPEKKRRQRDFLRNSLLVLGYKMLQKSIWVCPYNVEKETERLLRDYSLDQYVKTFLIEEITI